MKILHTTEVDFNALATDLQTELLVKNSSISSNNSGSMTMLFTQQVWQELDQQHNVDQMFSTDPLSTSWVQQEDEAKG
jgi:hypothetical protein